MDYLPGWTEDYAVGGQRTSANALRLSLGTFWTNIFTDQAFLKGYTLGMAEELIQSYYNLLEVVDSYSVEKIPVLHRERWSPLVITKSAYNLAPFTFGVAGGVFGTQPALDEYYAGQIFEFGKSKDSTGNIYSCTAPADLSEFSVIADRVLDPTSLYIKGIDVQLVNGALMFNSDIFANPLIPHAALVSDLGQPITYLDTAGNTVADEFIVLWIYNAGKDTQNIQNNFGTIFELALPSTQAYKDIMQAVVGLYASGPTISQFSSIVAAFLGTQLVCSNNERIVSSYTDNLGMHVITDRNAYLFDSRYSLAKGLQVGSIVQAGTQLTDAVYITDSVTGGAWWTSAISTTKVSFPSHLFVGNYSYQLFFDNALRDVVVDSAGVITFPVTGSPLDVAEFHKHMNLPENNLAARAAFGLLRPGRIRINPMVYLFENFFKNNTTLLKLKFLDLSQLEYFFGLSYLLKKHTPAHVYLLYLVDVVMPTENYTGLNSRLAIPGFTSNFAVDGSSISYQTAPAIASASATVTHNASSFVSTDASLLAVGQQLRFSGDLQVYTILELAGTSVTVDRPISLTSGAHKFDTSAYGARPSFSGDADYYKDYVDRVFCIAQSPTIADPPTPLYATENLCSLKLSGATGPRVTAGKALTVIPSGATTKEVSSLLLIDFS